LEGYKCSLSFKSRETICENLTCFEFLSVRLPAYLSYNYHLYQLLNVELNKVLVFQNLCMTISLSLSLSLSLRDEDISGFKRLCFLLLNLHGCQDSRCFGLKRILNTQGEEEEEGRKQIGSSEYTDILLTV